MMAAQNAVVCLTWTRKEDNVGAYTTGCVINKKNKLLILTCAHHLEFMFREMSSYESQDNHDSIVTRTEVKVMFSNLVEKTGELHAIDIVDDLSLVEVLVDESLAEISTVQFSENPLVKGERIWTIHNRGMMSEDKKGNSVVDVLLQFSHTTGSVSYDARFDRNLSTTTKFVEYWMPLLGPVSSGAPIFNEQNQIVAVHSFQLQNMQFGIHVLNIKNFFSRIFNIKEEKSLNEIVAGRA